MNTIIASSIILFAYLLGSISSAILVCKLMHLPDPRLSGSKNPGTTNVLRCSGKLPAFLTLLGDVLKGWVPVYIATLAGLSDSLVGLTGLAAFLGHLFPIFFQFKGGKGVATLLGVLLGLSWLASASWAASWIVIAAIFRYSSLASLIASILAVFYIWYFTASLSLVLIIAFMNLLLIIRHRKNIKSLIKGEERKLRF